MTNPEDFEENPPRVRPTPKSRYQTFIAGPQRQIEEQKRAIGKLNAEVIYDEKFPQFLNNRGFREKILPKVNFLLKSRISTLVVAYIDMDQLKFINDAQGHDAGDKVITILGETLHRYFRRETDIIAKSNPNEEDSSSRNGEVGKIGGDEFLIAVESDTEKVDNVKNLVEQARKDFEEKTSQYFPNILPSFSFGISVLGDALGKPYSKDRIKEGNIGVNKLSEEELVTLNVMSYDIQVAEMRMYEEKVGRGKGRV